MVSTNHIPSSSFPISSTSSSTYGHHPLVNNNTSSYHLPPFPNMASNSLLFPPPPPPLSSSSLSGIKKRTISSVTTTANSLLHKDDLTSSYRPLNVTDALTYLDQVKTCFADQPIVYNKFLDIMKDFKSQAIETPGVIERVSILFKGHPELIYGFNTFLPSGYRIEYDSCDSTRNSIIVISPTNQQQHFNHILKLPLPTPVIMQQQQQQQQQRPPPPPPPPPQHILQQQRPHFPSPFSYGHSHTLPSITNFQPLSSSAFRIPSISDMVSPPSLPPPLPPPEIINEPLNRYNQKDFRNAIDYVNKIKNRFFSTKPEIYTRFLEILQIYRNQNESTSKVYLHMRALFEVEEPMNKRIKRSDSPIESTSTDSLPPHFNPNTSMITKEEIELFEKIKRHIGNKPSYEAFLKTLQLYTLGIIKLDELIEQVEKVFLAYSPHLLHLFKRVVGYDESKQKIPKAVNGPKKPDLNQCQPVKSSPSYHAVPREWQKIECSGRDQLCWEVLNDEYVSHPIWASEDTGFVASKKNQFEEALHQCEEERYEYDLLIDANLHVISLLKPILAQTELQPIEDRHHYCLQLVHQDLQSSSTLRSIVTKVYGERASEIIRLLYQQPCHVLPTLIRRLEIKDKEWRRGRKEWNKKVWREWDEKNFYRSLDYQANTFKLTDRRAISTKSLLLQQETITDFPFMLCKEPVRVMKDMIHLLCIFMNSQQYGHYSSSEKRAICDFLQESFVPVFFSSLNVSMSSSFMIDIKEMMDDDSEPLSENDHHQSSSSSSPLMSPSANLQQQHINYYFCNSNYYCLFRLYYMFYERLCKIKSISEEIEEYPERGKKLNSVAARLDLISNRFEDIDLSKSYYDALLDIIERFFEGDYDQQTFEENARFVYSIDAYIMFTIDKLLHTLIKQVSFFFLKKKKIK
ncbi:Sin3 family co-repressor-domain-containing protein [Cokeromyces recurvatus]|uniref:Sin3 family co-repressor-domain-containing protein n=1 Tax=Cokeromyces recurvatus TaxID=90255 RepID=UPI00221EA6D9|nr:Sin3 family co-repressor-domain-containing protein [Cokeromyces recurvatus]KAI7902789.1 Sin3 family co-repressor-domain-containing protein [Cokeromyces recurvatus]